MPSSASFAKASGRHGSKMTSAHIRQSASMAGNMGEWRARPQQMKRGNHELHSLGGLFHDGLRGMQVVASRDNREKQKQRASQRDQRLAIWSGRRPTASREADDRD